MKKPRPIAGRRLLCGHGRICRRGRRRCHLGCRGRGHLTGIVAECLAACGKDDEPEGPAPDPNDGDASDPSPNDDASMAQGQTTVVRDAPGTSSTD